MRARARRSSTTAPGTRSRWRKSSKSESNRCFEELLCAWSATDEVTELCYRSHSPLTGLANENRIVVSRSTACIDRLPRPSKRAGIEPAPVRVRSGDASPRSNGKARVCVNLQVHAISRPQIRIAIGKPGTPQRVPHHHLVAGQDRAAEPLLQRRDQLRRAQRGAAKEVAVCLAISLRDGPPLQVAPGRAVPSPRWYRCPRPPHPPPPTRDTREMQSRAGAPPRCRATTAPRGVALAPGTRLPARRR